MPSGNTASTITPNPNLQNHDVCSLCTWYHQDTVFDQDQYAKPKHEALVDRKGYHSIINRNGYNFPCDACQICLCEKILNGDPDYIDHRMQLLQEIKNMKRK